MLRIERAFESAIFAARWLVAPFLLGLLAAMVLLLYRFVVDLIGLATRAPSQSWHDLVVGVLNLIDIALTANLILIVIFSGYENFIRKIGRDGTPEMPGALVDVNFTALKQKLLGSIAVIAAVDALAWYLDLENSTDLARLGWALGFPLMFFAGLLMLAIADRVGHGGNDGASK
jgi:uncharacterized protein (TIGR00645 family)